MPPPLKIIYMGTPLFALAPLEGLINEPDMEVIAVVTKPDKKVGRKQEITASPVKKMALKHTIPVLQPEEINGNKDFLKLIKNLAPDFIVVVAYGKILPKNILSMPKYGCVNIHPSLLPKYRGTSPIEEALLQGDKETGVTIMEMAEKFDSGNIFLVKKLPIEEEDTASTLYAKLFLCGAQMLPEVLKEIVETGTKGIPQNETKASYCGKIKKEDGLIDLKKMTAEEIIRKIKAYTPWPSCYIIKNSKRLKILKATSDISKKMMPEKIVELGKNSIGIGTRNGLLIPLEVQLEGRPAMNIESFLVGNRGYF